MLPARRIAEPFGEIWEHRLEHARVNRRGGVVIEIDRTAHSCFEVPFDAAIVAETERTQDDEQSQDEFDFYAGKVMSAKFYVNFILPQADAIAQIIKSGDRSALDIPDRGFSTAW